jgi:hypothetical protein
MRTKSLVALLAVLLAGSISAHAAVVTWNASGTWDGTLTGGTALSPLTSIPAAGSAFSVSIAFDTSQFFLGSCSGGSDCTKWDTVGLKFTLTSPSCAGGVCVSGADNSVGSGIFVGNDTAALFGPGTTNDVILFQMLDVNGIRWSAGFSTDDLSVFSSTAIPSTLDPRLLKQATFIMCDPLPAAPFACGTIGPNTNGPNGTSTRYSDYRLYGNLSSGTVPEPGTLALLGLGLAGITAVRRRK